MVNLLYALYNIHYSTNSKVPLRVLKEKQHFDQSEKLTKNNHIAVERAWGVFDHYAVVREDATPHRIVVSAKRY